MNKELVMLRLKDEVSSPHRQCSLSKDEAQSVIDHVNNLEAIAAKLIASLVERGIVVELWGGEDKG